MKCKDYLDTSSPPRYFFTVKTRQAGLGTTIARNSNMAATLLCNRVFSFTRTITGKLNCKGLLIDTKSSQGYLSRRFSDGKDAQTGKESKVDAEKNGDGENAGPTEDDPYAPFPDDVNPVTGEKGGPRGPEPTRYGDWERKGRCIDF